jgi:hypothetical protein
MNNTDFFLPKFDQFVFFLTLHNKIFHIEKLHDRSVYIWLHPYIFLIFFEDLKFEFFGVQITKHQGAWALLVFYA